MKTAAGILLGVFFILEGATARADVEKGRVFFEKKCVRCHKITDQNSTGPGLQGVSRRRSAEWLAKWLNSPREMLDAGDPTALKLLEEYKAKMPTIFEFQNEKGLLEDVLDYLKTL